MLCGKGSEEPKEKKQTTDGAKLEDSNMALYNSDIAKKARKAAADTEKEWDGAGKEEGVEIWRIENFGVKRWPKEQYGSFYSGDSYIVLETYKEDKEAADLDYNLFFWLGKTTSQDEYGTAAYKTVELDDKLGGEPVQSREVQGQESDEFEDLFPNMKIMEGGVASAFNHVEPEKYTNKLLIVRGTKRKNIKASEVPCSPASLSTGDAYVLDAGLHVFCVTFGGASVWEKRKANDIVDKLQKSRPKCEDHRVDALDEDSEDANLFWKCLGGDKPTELPEKYTADVEEEKEASLAVFKVADCAKSDSETKITQLEVSADDNGKLPKKILDDNSGDVLLISTGKVLYVWVGKDASKAERKQAIPLISMAKPEYDRMPTRKYQQGKEKKAFMELFA